MPEFIAMLGSAPGPKSLGQVPQQRIPNFSVASIANHGNLQGIPDFSVQSIAARGNLRGLGEITRGSIASGITARTGLTTGSTLLNFGTSAAGTSAGTSAGASTASGSSSSAAVANATLGGCNATIPFSAFVQMANAKVKAWSSVRQYADRAFIPAMLGTEGVDFYRRQAEPTQALKALTEPWSSWPNFDEDGYKARAEGRVGRAARYVDAVKNRSTYVTGPYKMEDETIAYGAPFLANALVALYNAKKAQYDADPELFKAEAINQFLIVRSADPTGPEFAENTILSVATAYVGAAIPGTLKTITDSLDSITTYANAQNQSGQRDTTRADGGLFLNTLVDTAQGFKSTVAKADPVSGDNKVNGYPVLVGKILAVAMTIANNIENWSGVAGLPPVRVTLSATVVQALDMAAPDAIRVICSFDRTLLVDPTKRTPSYILTSDASAQKEQAIKDAISAAQLVTVPEDRRLYSFSQLQSAATTAKDSAFSNCTLSMMDQATISQRIEDAITTRRLQTPAEVEAAVEKAKDDIQKLVDAAEGKYNAYLVQDAKDDAAAKNAADKAVADAQKAVVEAEKAGTNKMLIAVGAVAAVAVLAMIVMRKKE